MTHDEGLRHCFTMLAFIDDVKECAQCDTADLNAVTYCATHKRALDTLMRDTVKP